MDVTPVEIRYYQTSSERRPFQEWLDSLDTKLQQVVVARLARIRRGLLGDVKPVGGGVFELRIDLGPGYRIYCGKDGRVVVILLCAGDKKHQSADIKRARDFWQDYFWRTIR